MASKNNLAQYVLSHPLVRLFLAIIAYLVLPGLPKKQISTNAGKDSQVKVTPPAEDQEEEEDTASIVSGDLFPRHIEVRNDLESATIKPCATSDTTQYYAVKNELGELEWEFTDDCKFEDLTNEISPTISNSSNNDSIISNPTHNVQIPSPSSSIEESKLGTSSSKVHQCPQCPATFKLRGYLTRHAKKHSAQKAYSCPFHKSSVYIDENNVTHQCHPSGGFSRRDTYKTHLKSRHFKYPKGTKTSARPKSAGCCSMCGESFPNSEIWCEVHIEGGECKYLPQGFCGKSRIKNRLKRELKKKGILSEDEDKLDYQNLVELGDFSPSSEIQSPLQKSNARSIGSESSSPVSHMYASQTQSFTPYTTSGISTPMAPYHAYVEQVPPPRSMLPPSNMVPQYSPSSVPDVVPNQPMMAQPVFHNELFKFDYDDEFCLDVDQLNQFKMNEMMQNQLQYMIRQLSQQNVDMHTHNARPMGNNATEYDEFDPLYSQPPQYVQY